MNELQKARQKWLDAETRILDLQAENVRLLQENYRLKGQLEFRKCQAEIMTDLYRSAVRAILTV